MFSIEQHLNDTRLNVGVNMKRNITISVILLALSSFALGQIKSKSDKQTGTVEQTLMKIERELGDALIQGNSALLESYLADTFVFTSPNGNMLSKTQVIGDVKIGSLKMESSKREDMKVQIYGNTAVVTYSSIDKAAFKGKDISGQYRWTDVFENRNGQWRLVSEQGTPIRQKI